MRIGRVTLGAFAVATLAACGGGGGGGGGAEKILRLREADEVVSPVTPGSEASELQVCSAGPRIYAAWVERDTATATAGVFFSRSLDGGATWLGPARRLDDALLGGVTESVRMCCDGDRVYVVYVEKIETSRTLDLNRSLDAGSTFLDDDVVVDPGGPGQPFSPAVCCEGLTVHVAWTAAGVSRGGPVALVRYRRSLDGGATLPDPAIPLSSSGDSRNVALCCDGPHVYAAWRDGVMVRANRSVDAGASFPAADVQVSHPSLPTSEDDPPLVACRGATFTVAWIDDRNGAGDVFFNRSTDAGATFPPEDLQLDTDGPGASVASDAAMALDGDAVHVAWIDQRGGQAHVRSNRSEDLGQTFLADDISVGETPPGAVLGSHLTIASSGSAVVAAWDEGRSSPTNHDVFVAVSADGRTTFEEARADTDRPGTGASTNPGVAFDGDALTVVWLDERGGVPEIRTNRSDR